MTKPTTSMDLREQELRYFESREQENLEYIENQRVEREELPHSTKSERTPWEEVVAVLNAHYHEPDIEAARVLYGFSGRS